MALCSYDNELNQKYNFNKELKMTPAQKKAKEAKRIEDEKLAEEARVAEEAKRIEDEKLAEELTDTDDEDMNILEAFELAERSGKVSRRGWSKELNNHFVTINRGETKPSLSNGKYASPFAPSIDDVMTADWYNKEEEV
jgi:hypothetical protein